MIDSHVHHYAVAKREVVSAAVLHELRSLRRLASSTMPAGQDYEQIDRALGAAIGVVDEVCERYKNAAVNANEADVKLWQRLADAAAVERAAARGLDDTVSS